MSGFAVPGSDSKGRLLRVDDLLRTSKAEEHGSATPFDMFFWGVVAGVAGALVILFYVFYSTQ